MFTDFFYILKRRRVPVSITEWMTLMEALQSGCIESLDDFYYLARAILVKSEAYFDGYDLSFQEYFKSIGDIADIKEKILEWLKEPLKIERFFKEGRHSFDEMDLEKLLDEFRKRLLEQTEQHDGGSRWIGRGGTSPFGHSGYHPAGIRVGRSIRRGQCYADCPGKKVPQLSP